MGDIGRSLREAFDHAWDRFTARLVGLQDAEYLWEPVDDCWSIRPDADGVWRIDGAGGNAAAADPPPVTTIAWRIGHVTGMAIGGFGDRLFGDGSLTVHDLSFPATAAEVPSYCEGNYRSWRSGLQSVDDARWWQPLGARWAPYEESNLVDLVLHVLDEVVHHGAEVGLLRDLYRRRF